MRNSQDTHPFKSLDGQRKFLCTNQGEDFYLRVIASGAELARCAGNPKNSWEEMEAEPPDLGHFSMTF